MAFAHYPTIFGTLWSSLEHLAGSHEFVEACSALRACAEEAASQFKPHPIVGNSAKFGYANREVEEIRAINKVLSYGNMSNLMILRRPSCSLKVIR